MPRRALAWNRPRLRYLRRMEPSRSPDSSDRPHAGLILLLFFLSGGLALVYQVIWARIMTHVFGSTALAVGTVLAAYMAGLAIGSRIAGRVADRVSNRLRLYAWLELAVGAAALLTHLLLYRMDGVYPALLRILGDHPFWVSLLRFGCAFLLVAGPTVLMGATLPVLARFLVERPGGLGRHLSGLYAVNTLGAVCGALLTGFFLIGRFGIHLPVYGAVAGNLLVGSMAWWAARGVPQSRAAAHAAQGAAALSAEVAPGLVRLVVIGLGISGFTSFAYEIYWTRSLVFILGNSTYAMTTMLCAFLGGIALGSALLPHLLRRVRDAVALFAWTQILLALASSLALPVVFDLPEPETIGQLLSQSSTQPATLMLSAFALAFAVMLVPAVLIGMTFPLAATIASREPERSGNTVGRVYAVNTWGNVLGALMPGLVLLGWLGIQRGVVAMATLNLIVGLAVLTGRAASASAQRVIGRVVLPLLLVAGLAIASRAPLGFEFPSQAEAPQYRTLFYREGPLATTKVFADPAGVVKLISVDGIVIGGTGNTEFKQLLLAHLPKLLLDDTTTELSVGIGSGMLAGESALHDGVASITGVEIEPGVIEGAAWFDEENHAVLEDPRLLIVADDIGNFLRATQSQYQVISADEKTADEYASNGFSYSREYYRLLLDHLAAGGLVAQWVPTTLPPSQYRMILKTFSSVFPHVQLWYFLPAHRRGPFNTILIGSQLPIPLDPVAIQQRFDAQPAAFASLRPYGITSAEALLPHFVSADDQLRAAVDDAPINSLDHPRYEFYPPWDYAHDRAERFIENHDLVTGLRRASQPDLSNVAAQAGDRVRWQRTFAAEEIYLEGFGRFLRGLPPDEAYRIFDQALATAPWNDSLRARIYAQYAYLASTQRDPSRRAAMQRKADALYSGDPPSQ